MNDIILGFFKSKSSMMRLVLFIVTLCIWGPYAYTFIVDRKSPDLNTNVVLAWGFVVGGKAAQAYIEKKYPSTETPKA